MHIMPNVMRDIIIDFPWYCRLELPDETLIENINFKWFNAKRLTTWNQIIYSVINGQSSCQNTGAYLVRVSDPWNQLLRNNLKIKQ